MPRLAVVDIGTNSVKLTIADSSDGTLAVVEEMSRTTRLGEGVDQSSLLLREAMARTLAAADEFVQYARSVGTSSIAATGTSALRDAKNGAEFQQQFLAKTGIDLEIIAGSREAELGFKSVLHDETLQLQSGLPILVFDIGGGSTELICGSDGQITAHDSLNIGAVRLTERHLRSDPPTGDEYRRACVDAANVLASFPACHEGGVQLIGIGGTATNVAAVVAAKEHQDIGAVVTAERLHDVIQALLSLPLNERKQVEGLDPARADIIIGGTAVLQSLLETFHADKYQPSLRGMRYGLLAELAEG